MFSRSGKQFGVGRLPGEGVAGGGAGGCLVHGEDSTDRSEGFGRDLFDRKVAPASDDLSDVEDGIAFVVDRVPRGPRRSGLQSEPEQDRGVKRVHVRPALSSVGRETGDAGSCRPSG